MDHRKEHDFEGPLGACKGCGRYVEECLEHRYCTPKPNQEKHRVNFLTVSENASLKLAAEPIARVFQDGYGIYHVGSSITRKDYRDVDVRLIVSDELFDRLFGKIDPTPAKLNLWFLMCWALSEWMQKRTGLPIDFQIQSMAMANVPAHKGHPRNALFFDNSPE